MLGNHEEFQGEHIRALDQMWALLRGGPGGLCSGLLRGHRVRLLASGLSQEEGPGASRQPLSQHQTCSGPQGGSEVTWRGRFSGGGGLCCLSSSMASD